MFEYHDLDRQIAFLKGIETEENRELVEEALRLAGRTDLIGYGPKCLIRPDKGKRPSQERRQGSQPKKKTIRNIHKKKGS